MFVLTHSIRSYLRQNKKYIILVLFKTKDTSECETEITHSFYSSFISLKKVLCFMPKNNTISRRNIYYLKFQCRSNSLY